MNLFTLLELAKHGFFKGIKTIEQDSSRRYVNSETQEVTEAYVVYGTKYTPDSKAIINSKKSLLGTLWFSGKDFNLKLSKIDM